MFINIFATIALIIALKPADLSKVLGTVFEQAQQLKKATESACSSFSRAPNVTVSYLNAGCTVNEFKPTCPLRMSQVFLDEVNASTCGGLFKELIIDKSFEGEVTDNDEMLTSLVDLTHMFV